MISVGSGGRELACIALGRVFNVRGLGHLLRIFTAVTTNTRPQRVFSSVQTCVLVDVNQPLPWFFTRWAREDSFSVS